MLTPHRVAILNPRRTNILLQSEVFDSASWTKNATVVTANQAEAPNGTTTMDFVKENSASGGHILEQTFTTQISRAYFFSVYIKDATRRYAFVLLGTQFTTTSLGIDLQTGAIATGTGTPLNPFVAALGNGIWRFGFYGIATASGTAGASIYLSTDGVWANRSYAGDNASGVYVWGAQINIGIAPQNYIQTTTVSIT